MQIKPKMTPVGPFRLPERMTERLDQVADEMGHSRSSLVRLVIRDFLASRA